MLTFHDVEGLIYRHLISNSLCIDGWSYESDERKDGRGRGPDPVDVGDDVGGVEPHRGRGDIVVLDQGAVVGHVSPSKEIVLNFSFAVFCDP